MHEPPCADDCRFNRGNDGSTSPTGARVPSPSLRPCGGSPAEPQACRRRAAGRGGTNIGPYSSQTRVSACAGMVPAPWRGM